MSELFPVLYAVGFAITVIVAEIEQSRAPLLGRIPPGVIFIMACLWPLIWALNIAAWIYSKCR